MNRIFLIGSLCVALVLGTGCAVSADSRKPIEFFASGLDKPYSDAVRVGDVLYLSGQVGIRPDGSIPAGIKAQTRLAMENLSSAVAQQGGSMDDVFKCTVMLADMATWSDFNDIYVTFFTPGQRPARSSFATNGMAFGLLVEVVCLAHVPQ
ncbi:RidA family protein [Woeseia oceani]|uniref:RidA family protein n=1 Tax=Woeseia oceani TaxID=1548547 RepID=UPI0009F3CEB0|nr:RidA family protein [Woeseia oceani]